MSLTAIIFALIYFSGMMLTFYNPVFGVLTYIFEWHNHPPYFWWGNDLPDLRWSYSIAIVTVISLFINSGSLKKRVLKADYKPLIWMILMVTNMVLVSTYAAIIPEISFERTIDVIKKIALFVLLVSLVRTHDDYRKLMWVIILCVGYMGIVALGGSNRDIGVIAPNATEENALSAHVMAMLPIFGVYLLTAVKKWQKAIIALLIPFCLNLIILSNSRATMVALLAIGLLSVFLVKGKFKFAVLIGLVVGGATFLHLTNDDFHERQHAETYSDNSASSRLWLWRGAFEMWKDHPMGVGGGGFVDLSMSYIPEIDKPKSQHNTFVAAFSDWGFIGIFLYLALLTHCLRITMTVKRWSKWYPELHKYHLETTAVQLALIGLAIAGMFHSLQYSEVTFWLYAFAVIQKNLIREEIIEIENGEYSETESVYATETALSPVSQPVS